MTKILYKATSADGRSVADFVDADTVQEAKQKLVAEGLTDIVFMQAPQVAAYSQATIPDDPQEQKKYAELRASIQEDPRSLKRLPYIAKKNGTLLALSAGLLAYAAWIGNAWPMMLAIAGLVLPFALYFWLRRNADRYQRFLRAIAWGHWKDAQKLAQQLQGSLDSKLLQFDIDVRLAQIQAKQGDLAGALASLEKWRGSDAKSPGMFAARIASVHSAARDYPGYIALMEQAAELSKNDPSRLIDVALAHARFGDVNTARITMAQIDTSLLPPIASSFIDWVFGLLHLRASELDDAIVRLRAAAIGFRTLAYKSAAGWTSFALAAAHCAVAEAQHGLREQAAKSVDGLTRIIAAHGDPALLKNLRDQLPEQFPTT